MGPATFSFSMKKMQIQVLKQLLNRLIILQRNHSFQIEIWNGSFSVPGIENTQMAQEQTELPKLAIGKLPEKIGKWFANLRQATVRP